MRWFLDDNDGYYDDLVADFASTEKASFSVARRKANFITDDNDKTINLPDDEPLGWAEP